jgi:probable F420-dependent oxidoreductase
LKFCVSLAFGDPRESLELARCAEAAGFDSVAVSDHMVHPERLKSPYPYTEDGQPRWEIGAHWPDPWVNVAAMAAVTEHLRFYTSIFVLPMRNPFAVAKSVATASAIAQGRVSLGIGMGWMREEFEVMEQSFEGRGRRADEMVEVMRALWSGGMVEHHGEFYDFDRLQMDPTPHEPVPILVGGVAEPALRRAARIGDGWISDMHSVAELADLVRRIGAYREEFGRAELPFEVYGAATDAFDADGYRRMEEAGVTHILTMPWAFYTGPSERLEDKCEGIRRFGEDVVDKF